MLNFADANHAFDRSVAVFQESSNVGHVRAKNIDTWLFDGLKPLQTLEESTPEH